jgi:hypothetical protein
MCESVRAQLGPQGTGYNAPSQEGLVCPRSEGRVLLWEALGAKAVLLNVRSNVILSEKVYK